MTFSSDKIVYKYRSLEDIERIRGIFEDKRMYGAPYKDLNDPMEGIYAYRRSQITRENIEDIRNEKKTYRILALSETHKNMLLWSHYADSHKGIAIGVKIPEQEAVHCVDKVRYVENLSLGKPLPDDIVRHILYTKLKFWEYEKEVRVLLKDQHFAAVEIHEIILGCRISSENEDKIRGYGKSFVPEVKIIKMKLGDLDKGKLDDSI